MPRVMGIDIPGKKRLPFALQYIYGIGITRGKEIVEKCGINSNLKADDLSAEQIAQLTKLLQTEYKLEGDLRRETQANIRRLMSIGTYRGLRHRMGLPSRGQRTRTNARSRKGPRRTVGAVRGKAERAAVKASVK